jgi:isopropylmalate/homocitrate/citramalate synthase
MGALEKDKFWMCFTPYKPEIVGQKEKIIFGPTTLHGDAIRMKCEQLGFKNYEKYIKEILDTTHTLITKKKYVSEKELEELIKELIG